MLKICGVSIRSGQNVGYVSSTWSLKIHLWPQFKAVQQKQNPWRYDTQLETYSQLGNFTFTFFGSPAHEQCDASSRVIREPSRRLIRSGLYKTWAPIPARNSTVCWETIESWSGNQYRLPPFSKRWFVPWFYQHSSGDGRERCSQKRFLIRIPRCWLSPLEWLLFVLDPRKLLDAICHGDHPTMNKIWKKT